MIFGGLMGVLVPSLRHFRVKVRSYSQHELARRAQLDRSTIIKAERGKPLRYASVRQLAAALEVRPEELQAPPPA